MGKTNQIIVFVFFGQKYAEQFKVCFQSIPEHWKVAVITDVDDVPLMCELHKVPTPESVYGMLTYRKNIHDIIDVDNYEQVWYADPDMLFKGDILEKYKHQRHVTVSFEPETSMRHPCMSGGFNEGELKHLEERKAPAINGGLYCVPKQQYYFFQLYRTVVNWLSIIYPYDRSTDQHALNNIFHRGMCPMDLFNVDDVGFHARGGFKMVNHYIGMDMEKTELMKIELERLRNEK